jgi:hypothetical protein
MVRPRSRGQVAETIVDSAIEPDARPPIAVMEKVSAGFPTPVGGRPKESDFWRQNPGARDPVVVGTIPSPIPGGPDVALRRANRLYVDRQFWRGKGDRYSNADLSERGGRTSQHSQ